MKPLIALAVLVLSGCSSVWVETGNVGRGSHFTAESQRHRSGGVGVTYYEPMFVLAVACAEHGGYQMTIGTMPDLEQPRTVRWHNGLFGSVHPSVQLADGWRLASFDGEASSGGSEGIGVAADALTTVVGMAVVDQPPADASQGPGLYRLTHAGNTWHVGSQLVGFGGTCPPRAPPASR